MNPLKKELYDQHQKQVRNASLKIGLLNTPGVLGLLAFILYFKPVKGDIGLLIALCLYTLYTIILGIPYLIKSQKLKKEYERQITDLDARD